MAAPKEVYQWKGISELLGRSIRWCQDMSTRAVDPLPVRFGHRGPYIFDTSARDWVDRQDMSYTAHLELKRLRACANVRDGGEKASE